MAEVSGDERGVSPVTTEQTYEENGGNVRPAASEAAAVMATPTPLTASGLLKEGKSSRRRAPLPLSLLHGSDPVKVELNRLENEVRGENVRIENWARRMPRSRH